MSLLKKLLKLNFIKREKPFIIIIIYTVSRIARTSKVGVGVGTSIVYSQGEYAPHTSPHHLLQGLSHHLFWDLSFDVCLTVCHVAYLTCEPMRRLRLKSVIRNII